MTTVEPRRQRSDSRPADDGTGLGAATRILSGVFGVVFAAAATVRRGLGAARSVLGRCLEIVLVAAKWAFVAFATGFLAGFLVRPLDAVAPPAAAWSTVVACGCLVALLVRVRHRLSPPALRLAVALARLLLPIARPIGRLLSELAEAVLPVLARALRCLAAVGTPVAERLHALARELIRLVNAIRTLLSASAALLGRSLATLLRLLTAARTRTAARLLAVAREFIPLGHAIRRLFSASAASVGRALATLFGLLTAARARTAARLLAVARELVPLGHALRRLLSALAASIGRGLAPTGRGLATLGRLARTLVVLACAAVESMLRVTRRLFHEVALLAASLLAPVLLAAAALRPWWRAFCRTATHAARPALRRPGMTGLIIFAAVVIGAALRDPSQGSPEGAVDALMIMVLAILLAIRALIVVMRFVATPLSRVRRRAAHSLQVASAKARVVAPPDTPEQGLDVLEATRLDDAPPFELSVHQNPYLPVGGVDVEGIVRVSCGAAVDGAAEAAVVVLVDCSGSMAYPLAKLREARRATAAAIDALRDGTWFAVVRATDVAVPLYPRASLAPSTPETREAAKDALRLLWAEGGTAFGEWLLAARNLLLSHPRAIRHAILLTDGRDESETASELEAALRECRGSFQCDCRGIGTDWEVAQLRSIASALLGTVDIVPEPGGLESDFQAIVEQAMEKRTDDVALRLWTPRGAEVRFVRQVSPVIETLDGTASGAGPTLTDFATGAWGEETRDYHVSIRVPVRETGEEMLAGAVSMIAGGRLVGRALIKASWSDDGELVTAISPEVAHYAGQADLASAIRRGLDARRSGDDRGAAVELGRAVRLAVEGGNDETLRLLERIVEIHDAGTGAVALRPRVSDADEMTLDTRSTRSVRAGAPAG
jgi:hypothetical protein